MNKYNELINDKYFQVYLNIIKKDLKKGHNLLDLLNEFKPHFEDIGINSIEMRHLVPLYLEKEKEPIKNITKHL